MRSIVKSAGTVAVVIGGLAVVGPAMAQTPDYVGVTPPAVGPVDQVLSQGQVAPAPDRVLSAQGRLVPGAGVQEPLAPAASSGVTSASGLPVTGADVFGLTVMGVGAIGVGMVMVRRSRRRTPAEVRGTLSE